MDDGDTELPLHKGPASTGCAKDLIPAGDVQGSKHMWWGEHRGPGRTTHPDPGKHLSMKHPFSLIPAHQGLVWPQHPSPPWTPVCQSSAGASSWHAKKPRGLGSPSLLT